MGNKVYTHPPMIKSAVHRQCYTEFENTNRVKKVTAEFRTDYPSYRVIENIDEELKPMADENYGQINDTNDGVHKTGGVIYFCNECEKDIDEESILFAETCPICEEVIDFQNNGDGHPSARDDEKLSYYIFCSCGAKLIVRSINKTGLKSDEIGEDEYTLVEIEVQ